MPNELLGITGTRDDLPGRVFYRTGSAADSNAMGKTPLRLVRWYYVALVRDRTQVSVYLDGRSELSVPAAALPMTAVRAIVGGHPGNDSNFEGRVDEVALYDRALSATEVEAHFKASGRGEGN